MTEIELNSFAIATYQTYDIAKLNFEINKDIAISFFKDEIKEELDDLNSLQTKNDRHDYFKVEGSTLDDYSERVLNIDGERKIIFGIRHISGNVKEPFVNLIPNFTLSPLEAKEIFEQYISKQLSIFKPKYLCYWSLKKIETESTQATYLVSKSKDIKQIPIWPHEDEIIFENISNDKYYDWYKKCYEEFNNERPDLKSFVSINSLETMENSIKDNLMKYVLINNEKVGIISAEKDEFLGHLGIYFNEILISKKWKGKGLAKAIQRKFIESFCDDDQIIWGTINDHNIASYKTSLANGRQAIRFETFVTI